MISKQVLSQLEKLAKPGSTITYTDLNNTADKKTVSDPNNELAKAIKKGAVAEIVMAIYKNTSYKGTIGTDNKGKMHLVDKQGNIKPLDIRVGLESLSVIDPINNKKTLLQFAKRKVTAEVKKTLQDQLLESLKKKKMSDREVMQLVANMTKVSK